MIAGDGAFRQQIPFSVQGRAGNAQRDAQGFIFLAVQGENHIFILYFPQKMRYNSTVV
jgi:hypothetical protein